MYNEQWFSNNKITITVIVTTWRIFSQKKKTSADTVLNRNIWTYDAYINTQPCHGLRGRSYNPENGSHVGMYMNRVAWLITQGIKRLRNIPSQLSSSHSHGRLVRGYTSNRPERMSFETVIA